MEILTAATSPGLARRLRRTVSAQCTLTSITRLGLPSPLRSDGETEAREAMKTPVATELGVGRATGRSVAFRSHGLKADTEP